MVRSTILLLALPALLAAKDPCAILGRALYSQGQGFPRGLFLGEALQDPDDPVSIINLAGFYGATDGNGIYDLNGVFGSPESNYGAYNPAAEYPPRAWRYLEDGKEWILDGVVSANPAVPDSLRVHPDSLLQALEEKRCADAPRIAVKPDVRLDSFSVKGPPYSIEIKVDIHNNSNTEALEPYTLKHNVNDSLFFADRHGFLPRWERFGHSYGFRPKVDTLRIRLVLDEEKALDEADEGNNVIEALWIKGVLSTRKGSQVRPGKGSRAGVDYSVDGKRMPTGRAGSGIFYRYNTPANR